MFQLYLTTSKVECKVNLVSSEEQLF